MRKLFIGVFLSLFLNNAYTQDSCFNRKEFELHMVQTEKGNVFASDWDAYLDTYIGCNAPLFNVTTIKGEKISLAELKDKVVVLNFWYTSCGACIREFPELNRLVDEYAGQNVVFIAFALDEKSALNKFLIKHPLKYNIIPQAKTIMDQYQVQACPINIILTKKHTVLKIFHGNPSLVMSSSENYDRLKTYIDKALNK